MPTAGKSTIGKFIGEKSGLNYIDLDNRIEIALGKSINDIFLEKGESFFRDKETHLLYEIIDNKTNFILALGGGTPCFNHNMKKINKSGISIFVDRPINFIINNLKKTKNRPLFNDKNSLKESVNILYKNRISYYKKSNYKVKNREEALSIINSNSKS